MLNWERKKGNWFYSNRYAELKVAKWWGITPSQWDSEIEESKAEMIALYNTENKIVTYERHIQEIKNSGKNRSSRRI